MPFISMGKLQTSQTLQSNAIDFWKPDARTNSKPTQTLIETSTITPNHKPKINPLPNLNPNHNPTSTVTLTPTPTVT